MNNKVSRESFVFDRPGNYRIRVQGRLHEDWGDRLGGMHITTQKHEKLGLVTTLVGLLTDQASLSGILNALYELHFTLLSVELVEDQK